MPDFYGSLAGANQYHADRGNSAWTGTDEQKIQALVRGSQYIDGLNGMPIPGRAGCRMLFPGKKAIPSQPRSWPRVGAFYRDEGGSIDPETVPAEVVMSAYEASIRELASPGSLTPDFVASSLVKREKVGPLETEYAVSTESGNSAISPVVSAINSLLYSLLITRCGGPAVFVV
jgi:hypothetical protein